MSRYGTVYGVTDFIQKTVGKSAPPFMTEAAEFLKQLSLMQMAKSSIDLTVHVGDGVWVVYRGSGVCMVKPAQKHLSVLIWEDRNHPERLALHKLLVGLQDEQIADMIGAATENYTWRVRGRALSVVLDFLQALPDPMHHDFESANHPRNFPGEIREAALQAFEGGGSRCPGVSRPPHHIDLQNERIVFDHILPVSRGGENSAQNIQVLCSKCNVTKAASAFGNPAV